MRRHNRSTAAPLSWQPHFARLHRAQTLPQLYSALRALIPMLVQRGQSPAEIARDLATFMRSAGLQDQVAPIAHRALAGEDGIA